MYSLRFFLLPFLTPQTLNGTVKDAQTNEPLIGASVIAKGISLGTVTDEEGKFSLDIQDQKLPSRSPYPILALSPGNL